MKNLRKVEPIQVVTQAISILALLVAGAGLYLAWQSNINAERGNEIANEANRKASEALEIYRRETSADVRVVMDEDVLKTTTFQVLPCEGPASPYIFGVDQRSITLVNNGGQPVSLIGVQEVGKSIMFIGGATVWEGENRVDLPQVLSPGAARKFRFKSFLYSLVPDGATLEEGYERFIALHPSNVVTGLEWAFYLSDGKMAYVETFGTPEYSTFDATRYCQ